MDRPTCKTCLYFDATDEDRKLDQIFRNCIRYPGTYQKWGHEVCGEHPWFDDYIDWVEGQQAVSPPPSEPTEPEKA